jgi:CoA:oxalate CoA-transferase
VGDSVADLVTGLFGAWSLMTALFARERDGQGRQIDLSMFDAMLALQLTSASRLFASGTAPQRVGNRHPVTSPVDCFEARDGWVVIVVSNDGFFRRFAPLIGKPEWVDDPRFVDNLQRARNEPALKAAITAWSRERTVDEVVQACLEADVPEGPVWDLQQAHAQSARQDRGRIAQAQDAERPWPFVLQPAVFSSGDPAKVQADPLLGAHTDEVLQGIGIAPADLAQLRARGAV